MDFFFETSFTVLVDAGVDVGVAHIVCEVFVSS
jgi:hypothetical protein